MLMGLAGPWQATPPKQRKAAHHMLDLLGLKIGVIIDLAICPVVKTTRRGGTCFGLKSSEIVL
jgi:hypothetical protein